MSLPTPDLNPCGNSPHACGFSPHSKGGIKYRLLEKIALKGYTVASFARRHGLKRRDVSNFLRKNYGRVGKHAKQKVREAFIAEGLLKPRKSYPKIPCPTCGRLMRQSVLQSVRRLDDWLQRNAPNSRRQREKSKRPVAFD